MADPGDVSEDEYPLTPDEDFKQALLALDEQSLNSTASSSTSPQKAGTGESRWRRSVTGNETQTARKHGLAEGPDAEDDTYNPVHFGEFGRYMRNKRAKLQNQNKESVEHDGGRPQIFSKLAVYINGWTGNELGLPELQNLLISHGGRYVPYLDKKSMVTHIIATNLTPSKQKEFADYKVARPEWLIESVQEGRLKDWREYALLAAPTHEERVVDEYGEERVVSGTQRSLFGMLGGAGKGKQPQANVETIESLSARGARLAKEALKLQQGGAASTSSSSTLKSFFGGSSRPAVPSPLSRPSTPSKRKAPTGEFSRPSRPSTPEQGATLPATTDSPNAPTEVTHSWLPKAQRSERQNALLSNDEWLDKHSSRSPDFLAGYFAQSRLHHLSTFKEELKLLVTKHYTEHPPPAAKKSKKKLTGSAADGRTVMHVDLDMFFVSAGLVSRPELVGKPVAVCHSRGKEGADSSTSEIASCSYEARAAGVKNGMSLGRARELCAEIVTIPFEFDLYKEISLKFYNILLSHATFLQAGSMDEVFLEVSVPPTITRDSDPALVLANKIRDEIHAATGCNASIGIGHNMLLARLATRKAKPNGAFHLLSEDVQAYLTPLAVDDLPGIGWSMRDKLDSELGVKTVGDLLRFSKFDLTRTIGPKNAETYLAYARGLDDRPLSEGKERGSVSSEVNYGIRFAEGRHDQVERFVRELAEETAKRLQNLGLKARLLSLKLMVRHPDAAVETPKMLGHGWVNTFTKPSGLVGPNGATDDAKIIADSAAKLVRAFGFPPHELRGIGIQLQKLERDGVPVDAVREKGQNTLSFQPARLNKTASSAPPDRTPSPIDPQIPLDAPPPPRRAADPALPPPPPILPSSPQQRRTPPTPLRKEPSVIILDSDDDDNNAPPPADTRISRSSRSPNPPVPPLPARRGSSKRQPEYIPSMFRQTKRTVAPPSTAKSISDKELQKLGIEPATFHELPEDVQRDVIAQARRALPLPVKKSKTVKGKEVVPPPPPPAPVADLTLSSSSPAASTSRPEVLILPPTPDAAPTETQRVRDILGDDTWGAMGSRTQKDAVKYLQRQSALSVKGNQSRSTTSSSRPSAPVKDVKIRLPPRFDRHSDLDGICDLIESWVEEAQDGPENDDLEALGRFVEKCAMREKGHDLKKATDVMNWWSCVIEGSYGCRRKAEGAGKVWWERFDEVVERLDWVVLKETGCKLVL